MEASGIRKGRQAVPETSKGEDDPRPRALGGEDRKTSKAYVWLSSELGREPLEEEVAERLDWEVGEVRQALDVVPYASSLDQPLVPEKGTPGLRYLLQDESAPEAPDAMIREAESMLLKEAIGNNLPHRAQYVLIRRYGLDDRTKATLGELAEELGISRERVRQLQRKAEEKLKTGEHGQLLWGAVT